MGQRTPGMYRASVPATVAYRPMGFDVSNFMKLYLKRNYPKTTLKLYVTNTAHLCPLSLRADLNHLAGVRGTSLTTTG